MHTYLKLAAVALFALSLPIQSVRAQGESAGSTHPGAAEVPVITLDYQGSRLKRLDPAPTMSIYADGRVVMPSSYAHSRAYAGQISQAHLQSLLDMAVVQNDFFSYDEEAVKAKVRDQPGAQRALPEHLGTTVIQINAYQMSKTVSHFGLGHDKLVPETKQLLAFRKRLDRVMSVVKLGGAASAKRWLDLANADLSMQAPTAAPLTLDDLQSAGVYHDGSVNVRFARVNADGKSSVSATLSLDKTGAHQITIAQDDLLSSSQ